MRIPLIIALLASGIAAMTPDIRTYISVSEALRWPEVPATISALQFDIPVRLKDPYFEPHVQYKYTVDGREFTGDRISVAGSPFLGYDMGLYDKAHTVGTPVTVRVEPGKPENAILEPKPDLVSLIGRMMAVAMFFSLIYISTYPVILNRQQPIGPDVSAEPVAS